MVSKTKTLPDAPTAADQWRQAGRDRERNIPLEKNAPRAVRVTRGAHPQALRQCGCQVQGAYFAGLPIQPFDEEENF